MLLLLSLMASLVWASPVEKITCFTQVSDTLVKLEVTQPWEQINHSNSFTFLQSKANDKQTLSAWLGQTHDESLLIVVKDKKLIQHSFNPAKGCEMLTSISERNVEQNFSGLDFLEFASKHSQFVIILWSPHMAVSLKQLEDLKDKKLDIPILYILDHGADEELAKAYIAKEKFPQSYLRKWNSLTRLPANIEHYPSALFIKNGRINKYIPGINSFDTLKSLVKKYL